MTADLTKAPRVGLYCRVSTSDQSCANQIYGLREYAQARGWKVADEYMDTDVSGAISSRRHLDRLMLDARQRKLDVVLVWRFDRFARSTSHLLAALDEFRALNVDFASLQECIDTSTPMGKAVFTILAAIAELERSVINERVRAGIQRARREGKSLGRPRVDVDQDQLLSLRHQGLSVRDIARRLKISKSKVHAVLKSHATWRPQNPTRPVSISPELSTRK